MDVHLNSAIWLCENRCIYIYIHMYIYVYIYDFICLSSLSHDPNVCVHEHIFWIHDRVVRGPGSRMYCVRDPVSILLDAPLGIWIPAMHLDRQPMTSDSGPMTLDPGLGAQESGSTIFVRDHVRSEWAQGLFL